MLSRSEDKGAHWSEPLPLSEQPPEGAGYHAFLPAVAVNKAGVVAVSWCDTRERDRIGKPAWDVRLRVSADGGQTWQPSVRVTSQTSVFAGDEREIDIEADKAVITPPRLRTDGIPRRSSADATWVDNDEEPMEIHFEGNVVLRQDQNGIRPRSDRRIIRATQLDYEFATDHLTAIDAKVRTFGLHAPSGIEAPRIELTGFLTQQPAARSPAMPAARTARAGQSESQ